ncbi:hypothetical protein C0585_00860 [Candidatus Woesearchaeota archaeon]|nr:MAG: hypothetical protein C0585_00860 [Candidatus Woesearchaeota archaeon]
MEIHEEKPKFDPNNILIVGTSHIAKTSIKEVKQSFLDFKPDIIAVELDRNRIQSLFQKQKGGVPISAIKQIGITGYVFVSIAGFVQRKLGNMVGVMPGSEMKEAVRLANINKVPLALIDQDIQVTLARFSKQFTFKEKMRLLGDIFLSPFSKKRRLNLGMNFDLNKVPEEEIIEKMIGLVKKRYPSLYNVLIHERNLVMAKRLKMMSLKEPHKKIMAVVGAGHKKEMIRIINK